MKKHLINFFLKIVLPSFIAIALFIGFLFLLVKPQFEEALLDKKREMIKELVNSAKSILQKYYNDEKEGILTTEEAQRTAISRIKYLRYGSDNKDYFWITDMKPKMIMHPYVHDLVGKDLTNYTDPNGKRLFVECVEVVKKQKSGYVEYMWQFKDDSLHILPKISYVSLFEPWQWIIGTGVYIDDVKKEISKLTNRLIKISLIITIIIVLILIFIAFQSYKIEKKRLDAENKLQLSYEKYRSLVEASTEALVMTKDFKIVQANDIFKKLIQLESVIEKSIENYLQIPKTVVEQIKNYVNQITPFETTLITSSDNKVSVIVNISAVNISNEIFYVFTIRDIRPLKTLNEKLEATYTRLKALLDNINIGYIRTTLDNKGKILDANQTTLKLMGYNNIEHLTHAYIIDLYANNSDKRTIRQQLLQNGYIKNMQLQIKKRDGTSQTIIISLSIVKDENQELLYCEGLLKSIETNILSEPNACVSEFENSEKMLTLSECFLPLQVTHWQTPIENILKKLSENEYKYLIVENEKHEYLGYITAEEIISSLAFSTDKLNAKASSIMKSPIFTINTQSTVSYALSILQQNYMQLLLVEDNFNQKHVFYLPEYYRKQSSIIEFKLKQIGEIHSFEKLKQIKDELTKSIAKRILYSNNILYYLTLLSEVHDSIVNSIIKNALNELGTPPCDFAFIVMGSEARHEQTFSTDQDNAIIIEHEGFNDYFIRLGQYVSYKLHELGYSFCKGNNMASNPSWVQPLNVWKKYFTEWIHQGNAQDLLDIKIFFDTRTIYGNELLRKNLISHVQTESLSNKAYILLLVQDAIKTKISLSSIIRIKDIISLFVNIIRIYALNNNISEASTISRIKQMLQKKIINLSTYQDLLFCFNFLYGLRMKHQAIQVIQGKQPDNNIESKTLSDIEQNNLKYSVFVIQALQSKLSNDFKLY
ncbi:MAG: cache domain-containing protein [Bacteroidales bacterium]|nr:cache domain-containing protein [Bacteroidales bacterium]